MLPHIRRNAFPCHPDGVTPRSGLYRVDKCKNMISTNNYITQLPKPLLNSIIQNRCLPFIGSGFSKNAEIPKGKKMLDWDELGQAFAKDLSGYKYSTAIDAISSYEYSFSRPSMVEKMKELLLNGKVVPGNTHKALCQLQFDVVCTTNFDRLLEDTFSFLKRPCNAIVRESQLSITPSKDEVTLLKLHGDIYDPDSMVATEEDYDKFLDVHPLLSTFLSNLLITRTPLFLGYSLDDVDLRQIWQILKNRLGSLRRQAYTIKVGCSETEIKRYKRRGVDVINLDGDPKDYSRILEELFNEIKQYWNENIKIVSESETQSALAMPSDSYNRLCFFSVPLRMMPFYKDYLFPIAIRNGLVPITADSVVSVGDNWMAKVSFLISKSEYFVVDISTSNTAYEFSQIISQNKTKANILILSGDGIDINKSSSFKIIKKPVDFYEHPENVMGDIEHWFETIADKKNKTIQAEPERLLNKKEYKAAVISAVALLEIILRNLVIAQKDKKIFVSGMHQVSLLAHDMGIISEVDMTNIMNWSKLRNRIVHYGDEPTAEEATTVVNDSMKLVKRIKK